MVKETKSSHIILGTGFGDEGKGMFTDYLCGKNPSSIVIRFNGGQNAGHTVALTDGTKQVFSNLGSGTLRNVPTFWSRYCTFYPTTFVREFTDCPITLEIYVDKECPLTTHYDVLFNRALALKRGTLNYSTTGLGFGATVLRHETGIEFCVSDILNLNSTKSKLKTIRKYYRSKIETELGLSFDDFDHDSEDQLFLSYIELIHELEKNHIFHFSTEGEIFNEWGTFIFEGAQGVLLDRTHGSYPFVTKSNTTSKNAIDLIRRNVLKGNVEIYYVSRAYSTRHGVGPFQEDLINLVNTESETNVENEFQGKFRRSPLQIELLEYSLNCDELYSHGLQKNLVVTCLDQIEGPIPIIRDNKKTFIDPYSIQNLLNQKFRSGFFSRNPCSNYLDDIRKY